MADAYGGLAWLAARPDIDPARIAVFGASQGGDTALAIAAGGGRRAERRRFPCRGGLLPALRQPRRGGTEAARP